MGAIVDEVTAYVTSPVTGNSEKIKEILRAGDIDIITFTSSSTVTNLLAAVNNEKQLLEGVLIACIGPRTADTAGKAGLKIDIVAEESTIHGLVNAIEKYCKNPP